VADGLYEGRPVYIDHDLTGGPRRFADKFGRVVNVRYADGNGLRGDLRYNPAHPMAEVFAGWLEHDPNGVGFSHSAYGKVRREDGVDVVYELEEVESVDLVAEPATTKGIHESMNPIIPDPTAPPPDAPVKPTLDAAVAELLAVIMSDPTLSPDAKRDKILTALDLTSLAAPADAPAEGESEEEEEEEEGDGEDKPKKKPAPPEERPDSDERAEEACRAMAHPAVDRLLAAYDRLRGTEAARLAREHSEKMARAAGLEGKALSEVFLGLLTAAPDDAAREALINDRKAALAEVRQPVSVAPAAGGKTLTVDDLIKALTEGK